MIFGYVKRKDHVDSQGQAMVQAIETGAGQSKPGVTPVEFRFPSGADEE